MIRTLIVEPAAQLDIEEAAFWYEEQRDGLGDRFSDELGELFRRLTENPLQFPQIDRRHTRRGLLDRFPYAVYFIPSDDAVSVIAVLHQRRHPNTWKKRRSR